MNARDAMPEGGALRISVRTATVDAENELGVAPGTYLRLAVADTGCGMDEETRQRAVEPFFSTKGVGKGTGLGLSMAHGFASQLGGAMTIVSKPGAGTRIELWLPESAEQMTSVTESAPSLDFELSGSALVVDDEQLVRQSTADMLADLGFTVVEADSGEAALTLIQQGLAPDLLVTDNLMPGMSGTEFPRRTKSLRPATKVLLVSGYAENEGIDPNLPRLTKPFRNIELIESLAALS